MNTANAKTQVESPQIHLSLSDARQMGPEAQMWVAVITLAIFDATRKVEISRKKATAEAKRWRIDEYKNRSAVKDESRKWLARGCVDILGLVNVLALLDIDPSWFHGIISRAHPELR